VLKFVAVNQITNYFREVRVELTKVSWPKREEVIKLTAVVSIISVIVGAYLGALDLLFTKMLEYIINI
jgi:preprotein translocase subunit SecE